MTGEKATPILGVPYDNLRLYVTSTSFFIHPQFASSPDILAIDRASGEIQLQKNDIASMPIAGAEIKEIFGIFGIIRLLGGRYLIVIRSRIKVGEINDRIIWKILKADAIPYQKTLFHLNEQQQLDNAKYLSMVESILAMESFYYSTTYDLTHTMQRLYNTSPDFKQIPLHDRVDQRFVWNGFILKELTQQAELSSFCIPIILGFVSITPSVIRSSTFKYILISRRSCFRAGTRYYMRGIDADGNVANFVETEQIVEFGLMKSSFVQTRGSLPFYWNQFPNLKYKPLPQIEENNHMDAFHRHFATQVYNYGQQVNINLLDQKFPEINLVKQYSQLTETSQNTLLRLESFDFHHECRKMRWHRLSILMDRINAEQEKFGYFSMNESKIMSTQSGIFRTNCIDCLDRTNVVQSMIAKRSLTDQLIKMRIIFSDDKLENFSELDKLFRNTWADNADACAKQYAGTGALKTDFTRTGKRTILGALKDGWNSINRYFLNNFYDGYRQDCIDLFLGNYEVELEEGASKTSALKANWDWKFYALPAIFVVAFSMCIVSLLIPDENWGEQLMYVLFWGGASASTLGAIYAYGNDFVDRPKLAQKKLKSE